MVYIFFSYLQTTLREDAKKIKACNGSNPRTSKCYCSNFFPFKSHGPLNLYKELRIS